MAVNPMSFQVGNVSFVVQPNHQPVEGTTPRDDLYRLNLSGDQKTEMEPLFIKAGELIGHKEESLPLANTYKEIGDKLESLKLYQDAINYFQKAIEIYRKEHGENHEDVAYCYFSIGWDMKSITEELYHLHVNNNIKSDVNFCSKFKETIDFFQKALDIRLQFAEEYPLRVASCYFQLGWVFCNIGTIEFKTNSFGSQMHKFAAEKIHTAIDYGKKALEIYRLHYEEKPENVAKVYRLLANCSKALSLDGGQTVHLGSIQKYEDLAGAIEQAVEWKKPLPILPGGPKKASDQKCSIS